VPCKREIDDEGAWSIDSIGHGEEEWKCEH